MLNLTEVFEIESRIARWENLNDSVNHIRKTNSRIGISMHSVEMEAIQDLECKRDSIAWGVFPEVISLNLQNLGVRDMNVKIVVENESGRQIWKSQERKLSNACGRGYRRLLFDAGVELQDLTLIELGAEPPIVYHVTVIFNEENIGHIDTSDRFIYEAARSTKEALGWFIATDCGRFKMINFFDLLGASEEINRFVYHSGADATFPTEDFGLLLRLVFGAGVARNASSISDAQSLLWKVARRKFGLSHL